MSEIIKGPLRAPAQMLQEQTYDGHKSLHDDSEAERLGIKAGPIEGPTHFSQFVPLLADVWGDAWFERGCFSSHFLNMVFEGEKVWAEIDKPAPGATRTTCRAFKEDGTPVLEASASIGPDHGETLLEARMKKLRPAEDLVILGDMKLGLKGAADEPVTMGPDQNMGGLYPFSLNDKLKVITESVPAYADAAASPWGRRIIPLEMVSVIGNYTSRTAKFPVKQPAIGLFADLEVRMIDGPLFVDEPYILRREVVALGESRRVENYWIRTKFFDSTGTKQVAEMLLNHGVMKASYPHYPADRPTGCRPEETIMALSPELQTVADNVDRDGWTKVYVQKNPADPNSRVLFTVTVGMQEKFGLPELVVFGLDRETIDGMIHNVAAKLVNEKKWTGAPLRMDGILNEAEVELRAVHAQHLGEVGAINIMVRRETGRPPLQAMIQVFWPGDDGRFPWDPESTDDFRDQPRLDAPWKQAGA